MNNPGRKDLMVMQITGPTVALLTPITGLDGMIACTLEANFQWGSGGGTASAIVVASCDGGTTWRHVARFDFTTASAVKTANLSGLTPKNVAAYADLASEGVNDGLLSDMLAVRLTTTGNYVGTVLSIRALCR